MPAVLYFYLQSVVSSKKTIPRCDRADAVAERDGIVREMSDDKAGVFVRDPVRKEGLPQAHVVRKVHVSVRMGRRVIRKGAVHADEIRADVIFVQKAEHLFLREARILREFAGEPGIVQVRDYFE